MKIKVKMISHIGPMIDLYRGDDAWDYSIIGTVSYTLLRIFKLLHHYVDLVKKDPERKRLLFKYK